MRYIGIDIVEIGRIKSAISRLGDSFLGRVYTEAEVDSYRGRYASLAARFAAKEAVIKALGGFYGGAFKDIEVLSDLTGKPGLKLYGAIKKRADAIGIGGFDISISHCREYAVAFVIGREN
ncbi:MAG: holo-ACP synthase [Dehalococcoidales bacterium]